MSNKKKSNKTQVRSHSSETWHRLKKNKGAMLGLCIIVLILLTAILSSIFIDYDTQIVCNNISERLQHPSLKHPFGTDDMGRDLLVRVIYGSRYSMLIGMSSVLFSTFVGVSLGAIAGYKGGKIENFIMRIMDIFSSIPSILLAIIIVAVLGESVVNLIVALAIAGVPGAVRISRASVLTVRDQEYIEASRAIGLSEWKIITRHILPNCLSPIIVQTTLCVASAIISASALSFLGLGVPVPTPEWGAMLNAGRQYIRGYSYMTLFPGLAIMIVVLSLNLLGDGLRDAMDPKLKK